jgi:hypothetical protein
MVIKMVSLKKMVVGGLIGLTLLGYATGCTNNNSGNNIPTPTSTIESTVTPTSTSKDEETIDEKVNESFEEMYSYVKNDISSDSYDKLEEIYNNFDGLEIRFDMDEYGAGEHINVTEKLLKSKYDYSIEQTYDFLQFLTSNGTDEYAKEIIGKSVDQIANVTYTVYKGNKVNGLNRKATKDMMVSYNGNETSEKLLSTYLSEISDLIFYHNGLSLDKFRSYNGFEKYDEELNDGEMSFSDYVATKGYTTRDEIKEEYYKNGLLSNIPTEIYDDMNCYFCGLFLGETNFWDKYQNYELIQNKTNEIVNQLNSINPNWTMDFFQKLSNPNYQ